MKNNEQLTKPIDAFPQIVETAKQIDLKFEITRYSSSPEEYEALLIYVFKNARKRLKSLHNAKSARKRWEKTRENNAKSRQICVSTTQSELVFKSTNEMPKNESFSNFLKWWGYYPKKRRIDKKNCEKKFSKLKPDEQLMAIQQIIEATTGETDWTKDNGTFCPMTTTYLNQRRFEQIVKAVPVEEKHGQMIIRDDRDIKLL